MPAPAHNPFTVPHPATPASLTVPSPAAFLAHHVHRVLDAAAADDQDLLEGLRDCAEEDGFGCFLHPVWWVSPSDCARPHTGVCTCGRVGLAEVLGWLTTDGDRQQAFDVHRVALAAAAAHLAALDAILDGAAELGAVCADCLTCPEVHRDDLAQEVWMLAAELGEVLVDPAFEVQVSVPSPSARRRPALHPSGRDGAA